MIPIENRKNSPFLKKFMPPWAQWNCDAVLLWRDTSRDHDMRHYLDYGYQDMHFIRRLKEKIDRKFKMLFAHHIIEQSIVFPDFKEFIPLLGAERGDRFFGGYIICDNLKNFAFFHILQGLTCHRGGGRARKSFYIKNSIYVFSFHVPIIKNVPKIIKSVYASLYYFNIGKTYRKTIVTVTRYNNESLPLLA